MIDMTYDPEADAAYIHLARGKVAETREEGPFIYDVDRPENPGNRDTVREQDPRCRGMEQVAPARPFVRRRG